MKLFKGDIPIYKILGGPSNAPTKGGDIEDSRAAKWPENRNSKESNKRNINKDVHTAQFYLLQDKYGRKYV